MSNVSAVIVEHLRCEYKSNPLGIDVPHPRLSWQLSATTRGALQTAYQIQASHAPDEWNGTASGSAALMWDTGKVPSADSVHIAFEGPLHSAERVDWRVRAWDEQDRVTPWSGVAWWEMGLLEKDDWHARWIEPGWEENPKVSQPCPYLRKVFRLAGGVQRARV